MGHLLVPLREGLFEARFIAVSRQTGMRESVLLMKAMAGELETSTLPSASMEHVATSPAGVALKVVQAPGGAAGGDADKLMASIDYDAERYDALFPTNVLSIARRNARWIRSEAGLRVSQPGAPPDSSLVLRELRCAITPPPRFALDHCDKNSAQFHRVSLAGNDGVQQLLVERSEKVNAEMLVEAVRASFTSFAARAEDVRLVEPVAPLLACVVGDGSSRDQVLRIVGAAYVDEVKAGWLLYIVTTPSQDAQAIFDELAHSAQSLRPHTRPWWRLW
jgi:hypothetical protein